MGEIDGALFLKILLSRDKIFQARARTGQIQAKPGHSIENNELVNQWNLKGRPVVLNDEDIEDLLYFFNANPKKSVSEATCCNKNV